METKKIRIGNDIRLAVDIRQYLGGNKRFLYERDVYNPEDVEFENIDSNIYVNKDTELYYPNQYPQQSSSSETSTEFVPDSTPICIKSVKAILINTTRRDEDVANFRKQSRFITRFPMEPGLEMYHSTPYDICCSGYHSWRAYPGFGLHPQFGGFRNILAKTRPTEYVANVLATYKPNVVEVIFPAEDQYYVGKYKLVLVIKAFAPGYNNQNLRTITIDVPDVFELVKTTDEGEDTGFKIHVTDVIDKLPDGTEFYNIDVPDVYVRQGGINEDTLALNRTDNSTVNIDLSSITSWYNED